MTNRLRYFDGITTLQGAHQRYRLLAKKLHPDVAGGNAEWFREMAAEYAIIQEQLRRRRSNGKVLAHNDARTVPDATPPPVSAPPERRQIVLQQELDRAVGRFAGAVGTVLAAWLKKALR